MAEEHSTFEGRAIPTLIVVFSIIAVLVIVDIFADLRQGTTVEHVAPEAGIGLAALAGIGVLIWRVVNMASRARHQARRLATDLETTRRDAVEWRAETQDLLRGLASRIDRQFDQWKLSPAEKDVALLLLKGFSHREVAELREVSEATARQQARAVYRKAGFGGRHDLAGYFLEDLSLPAEAAARGNGNGNGKNRTPETAHSSVSPPCP